MAGADLGCSGLFEYQILFDARGARYSRANRLYPEARSQEAAAMLRHLDLSARSRWLDVFTGGGYLSERALALGLPAARFVCDGSIPFLRSSEHDRPACLAKGEALPFTDAAFDAAACLAALHHSNDPESVCRELLRVTAPGGRAALGDAAADSRAARFLNSFVDRHTESGHRGSFYSLEDLSGFFQAAGGRDLRCQRTDLDWVLPSALQAASFCRDLFGLLPTASDGEILEALRVELGAGPAPGLFRIPWTMHYVSARRA